MKITQLQGVKFEIQPQPDGTVVLTFSLPTPVGPEHSIINEIYAVPFDGPAWQNFKRAVEADGAVSAIDIAKSVPTMAIPGQR